MACASTPTSIAAPNGSSQRHVPVATIATSSHATTGNHATVARTGHRPGDRDASIARKTGTHTTETAHPFYVGVVQWGGARYEGQHKALIPQSLFERVQETLRARDIAGVRQRRHEHYLKGLLHCGECGRRLSLTLANGRYLYFYCLGQRGSARTGCRQPYILAGDAEALVEDLYRQIQLPRSWVRRLTEELEAEIVERQAEASERRVLLTKTLAKLAEERGKLLQAFYANATPLDLLKAEQDRIGAAEQAAKAELERTEGDLDGWQDILRTAIRLAGNCHTAYLKARPSVRRRFNDAVLQAVYIKDRRIGRTEFSEVFAPLFSRPSSNKARKVDLRGHYSNSLEDLQALLRDYEPLGG
jgi:hypothetical protein